MLKLALFFALFICLHADCMPEEGPEDIRINQPHYLCMTVNGNERTVFHPVVDQYGRFVYTGLYQAVKDKNVNNVYVQLSISSNTYTESRNVTVRSISKLYTGSLANNGVFKVMTAIINVDHGVVQSISWDDNCNTCLTNCADNSVRINNGELELITAETELYNVYHGENCYESRNTCDQEGANCDLQIFVVWSGTDSRGRVFQSSNLRMTRFQSGSVESIIHNL